MARPVQMVFLRPIPLGPMAGRAETRFGLTWANDFRRSGPVDEDAETVRLAARWRWAGTGGRDAWLEVPVLARGGGLLDGAIDAWHRSILGWEDPTRAATARYRSVVGRAGAYRFGSAAGLGDIAAGVGLPVPGATLRLAVELPTGDAGRLLGSGGVDASASLERTWRFGGRWTAGVHAGVVYQGPAPELPGARRWADTATLWLAFQPNRWDTWLVQSHHERAAVRTGVPGPDSTQRVLAVVYRRRTGDRSYLELSLVEDRDLLSGRAPAIVNQGPDVAFGVGWVWR